MSLKIVYCIPSLYYPSGMERVVTLKANYFAEVYGYEVVIILTDGKDKKPFYSLSPLVRIINLDINYDELYGKSFLKKTVLYLKKQRIFKKRLRDCLFSLKPDISISTLRREINFFNSIKDGSIKIGEIHFSKANYRDFKSEKFINIVQKSIAFFWMRQLIYQLKKLDKFITLTEEDKMLWTELKNVQTINNPLSFFPDRISQCENKQIIAAGRYVPQKGFDLLIEAWSLVEKKHPDWKLLIFGDGDRKLLENIINKNNLQNCYLKHSTNDIASEFINSSIYVLSSRFEGFGMVIIEAMACGVPPIAFDCPCGPKDIIYNLKDGILVNSGDINELAEKICFLIENEDLRKNMGINARKNAERFKIEHIAEQWKLLFEELINKSNNK
ncbi:MAG: glycosyltransferase family 4 protein [Macellibacteroides sp.]|uniref:Glycosyltransferase involved in cell wall bisynthesis n=2 Tax=Bacteroidales TaxID=171549 RepID=A0A1T5E806_9BACT|nr:glycosyltransferase family 4 protein [Parabacteroides chartae]SKB79946.1 Glycosyltransferase involved in cell wall bisynthesis [Parabacteroides chartae]